MRISRWVCSSLLAVVLCALYGCAAVGVTSSEDPGKKLTDAGHLLDQGRALPAERLIHEAIAIYRGRDDPHGLGYAYGLYAELLQSNAVKAVLHAPRISRCIHHFEQSIRKIG